MPRSFGPRAADRTVASLRERQVKSASATTSPLQLGTALPPYQEPGIDPQQPVTDTGGDTTTAPSAPAPTPPMQPLSPEPPPPVAPTPSAPAPIPRPASAPSTFARPGTEAALPFRSVRHSSPFVPRPGGSRGAALPSVVESPQMSIGLGGNEADQERRILELIQSMKGTGR